MVTIIKSLLSIADKLIGYFTRKQLIDAGKAEEAEKRLQETNEKIRKAIDVRRAARDDDKLRDSMSFRDDD